MQVRVRGLGSHAARATPRAGAAPPRRGAGDGDGLLADGRAPVDYNKYLRTQLGSLY